MWIIEKDLFHDDLDTIQAACQRNKIDYRMCQNIPFSDDILLNEEEVNIKQGLSEFYEPIIFYGTLNLASKINRLSGVYPGTYASLDRYKCTEYYPYLGKYLLNNNYCMIPFSELPRLKSQIFNHFGVEGTIFIRPNDGFKSFTGTTISWFDFDKDLEGLKFYKPNPSDLIIVSTPKRIEIEYRLVIADGKVITGSQYKYGGKPAKDKYVPEEMISFGNKVAKLYQPDKAFVIDVCAYIDPLYPKNLKYAVVEINSFSCSGFYCSDRDIIVQEVTKLVQKDYDDVYSNI
jgi:hypothetical protein